MNNDDYLFIVYETSLKIVMVIYSISQILLLLLLLLLCPKDDKILALSIYPALSTKLVISVSVGLIGPHRLLPQFKMKTNLLYRPTDKCTQHGGDMEMK